MIRILVNAAKKLAAVVQVVADFLVDHALPLTVGAVVTTVKVAMSGSQPYLIQIALMAIRNMGIKALNQAMAWLEKLPEGFLTDYHVHEWLRDDDH